MRPLTLFIFALAVAAPAPAAVYYESVDAGALPFMAEDVLLAGPVDSLEGRIAHSFDTDLFRIRIDDPAAFSARANVVAGYAPDPQLFLFDQWGRGIVANDNWLPSPLPQIPSGTLQGWSPGTYLLGVSPAGNDPLQLAGERIFPDVATGLTEPAELARFIPLFDWTRDPAAIGGTYAIELTGVSQSPTLPGDYNNDGTVDAADYTVWRDHLGSGTALPNDDTAGVGQDDYDRWGANYGENLGSGSVTTIPEPIALALSLIAIVVCDATRLRKKRAWVANSTQARKCSVT